MNPANTGDTAPGGGRGTSRVKIRPDLGAPYVVTLPLRPIDVLAQLVFCKCVHVRSVRTVLQLGGDALLGSFGREPVGRRLRMRRCSDDRRRE